MAEIRRTYNVPLRKGFLKVPKYKRAKKAVNTLRAFLIRHMKSEDVKIGKQLNNYIWRHGIKNPPHHVKVDVVKEDDGTVLAELAGIEYKHEIKPEKKEETAKDRMAAKLGIKKKEEKKEEPEKESEAASEPKAEPVKKPKVEKKAEPVAEKKPKAKPKINKTPIKKPLSKK